MNRKIFTIAILTALSLGGCTEYSNQKDESPLSINCAIEIQVAVVSGRGKNATIDEGEWRVAARCLLPITSSGGSGHVISSTDGTIVEMKWDRVQMSDDGTRIVFSDCEWAIRNQIERRDGVSQRVGGRRLSPPLVFGSEFDWLATCEIDTAGEQKSDRRLVIRGRLLPEAPTPPPLKLADLTL